MTHRITQHSWEYYSVMEHRNHCLRLRTNWNDSSIEFIHTSPHNTRGVRNDDNWWNIVNYNGGSCIVLKTKPDGNFGGRHWIKRSHRKCTAVTAVQAVTYLNSNRSIQRISNLISERIRQTSQNVDTSYDENTIIEELRRYRIQTLWTNANMDVKNQRNMARQNHYEKGKAHGYILEEMNI